MKKRFLSVIALLIALMLVVFTGCEKEVKRDTDSKKKTEATTEKKGEGENAGTDEGTDEGTKNPESGEETTEAKNHISMDRVNNAMLNNKVDATVKDPKPDDNNEEDTTQDSGEEDEGNSGSNQVVEVQDDEAVIKSGEYYIIGKTDMDGTITPIEIAVKNDRIYMNVVTEQGSLAIIILPDGAYIIVHDTKMCIPLTKEFMESQGLNVDEMMKDIQMGDKNEEPVKVYKETIDGIVYDVKEYDSGNKVYFIGKTMIKSVSADGSSIYYEDIIADVPDSLFVPPSDYTIYE